MQNLTLEQALVLDKLVRSMLFGEVQDNKVLLDLLTRENMIFYSEHEQPCTRFIKEGREIIDRYRDEFDFIMERYERNR